MKKFKIAKTWNRKAKTDKKVKKEKLKKKLRKEKMQ